ncbi:MAG: FAD-dependent monooxygenase [Chitinophaga sp.]|uniref:FAD-dependent oxidoreductase n=1 Tax=Chitinophaga sp. TaxID=1869181 RepID=UPI001B020E4F|nr:NAD(P)/FAD-dependent oxidoreductase [Chitinophaga sp.]MBO9728705.1 FAD-dependent monooxygenase [Chitinophaga sp.]
MSLLQNKKTAIIGGGPGGLTLARLLQMAGAQLHVYERDVNRSVRVQGATLDLHADSGLMALEAAGLMNAFKANYRPGADKLRIADKNAQLLMDEPIFASEEMFRPEIDRGPLRNILIDSLQPDTIVWNSYLTSLHPMGNGWQLTFQNGSTAYADIVLAADGANSIVRSIVTPIRPLYSGVTMVEGSIYNSASTAPALDQLVDGGKVFVLGDEKSLILSSKGDGSLVFYTGCKTDEDWVHSSGINFYDRQAMTAWFQTSFAGWNPLWMELIDKASLPLIPRPQYCMPPDQHWEALPNITLLGDAAHLMPPFAGEGVNMAMLDALELSQCLTQGNYQDVHSAIAAYEQQMRIRAGAAAVMTMEQTTVLHSPSATEHLLRMFS